MALDQRFLGHAKRVVIKRGRQELKVEELHGKAFKAGACVERVMALCAGGSPRHVPRALDTGL